MGRLHAVIWLMLFLKMQRMEPLVNKKKFGEISLKSVWNRHPMLLEAASASRVIRLAAVAAKRNRRLGPGLLKYDF